MSIFTFYTLRLFLRTYTFIFGFFPYHSFLSLATLFLDLFYLILIIATSAFICHFYDTSCSCHLFSSSWYFYIPSASFLVIQSWVLPFYPSWYFQLLDCSVHYHYKCELTSCGYLKNTEMRGPLMLAKEGARNPNTDNNHKDTHVHFGEWVRAI